MSTTTWFAFSALMLAWVLYVTCRMYVSTSRRFALSVAVITFAVILVVIFALTRIGVS